MAARQATYQSFTFWQGDKRKLLVILNDMTQLPNNKAIEYETSEDSRNMTYPQRNINDLTGIEFTHDVGLQREW